MRRLRNRLEGLVHTNQKVFEQFADMLGPGEQERVRETLRDSLAALVSDDADEMEAALFDLNTVSQTLSELMLKTTSNE